MKGYRFDPALLARQEADPTFDPYRAAAQILRDYLGGGDIFAEICEHVERDPRIRGMSGPVSSSGAASAHDTHAVQGRWSRHQHSLVIRRREGVR